MYLLFMLSSHANAHFTALCLWWLCLMWLLNFSQSDIWWPMSLVKRFWIVYATCIYGSVSYVMTLWSLPHPPQATQEVVSRVPCATQSEMNAAVEAATRAYPAWRETSVMTRQRVMFNLQHIIRENMVGVACGCGFFCLPFPILLPLSFSSCPLCPSPSRKSWLLTSPWSRGRHYLMQREMSWEACVRSSTLIQCTLTVCTTHTQPTLPSLTHTHCDAKWICNSCMDGQYIDIIIYRDIESPQ